MTRREQVNCASLAAILVALLLLAGSMIPSATAATSAAAPVTATAAEATDPEFDAAEPSGIAGLTAGELVADAWDAYRSSLGPEAPAEGQFTIVPEYFASYEGSAPQMTSGYFTIESHKFPGVFHAIHMVAAQRA